MDEPRKAQKNTELNYPLREEGKEHRIEQIERSEKTLKKCLKNSPTKKRIFLSAKKNTNKLIIKYITHQKHRMKCLKNTE